MTEEAQVEPLGWCVVANIAEETVYGQDHEIRRGLKHFAAGAKVWVLPAHWGDGGERLYVIGRHRGAHERGYILIVVERRHLTNFRVQGIYSPAVMKAAEGYRMWGSLDDAEEHAAWWSVGDEAWWRQGAREDWLAERAARRDESSRPG